MALTLPSASIPISSINANLCTLDSAQNISAIKTHSVESIFGGVSEAIATCTVTTNATSINYIAQAGQIYYTSPSSAANIALTISNVPLATFKSINLTFIINTGTYKQYINSININGTVRTISYINGLANIPVLTSATSILQTFNIICINSNVTPFMIYSSVVPCY